MMDMVRRLLWFGTVSCAVAYALFLVVGSVFHARASEAARIVLIRDRLEPNAHYLSGMVMVPRTCKELSVRAEQISDDTYKLLFKTWDVPSIACEDEEVPRHFNSIIFAPAAGVRFIASLDGAPLPITVIQAMRE